MSDGSKMSSEEYTLLKKASEDEVIRMRNEIIEELNVDIQDENMPPDEVREIMDSIDRMSQMSPVEFWNYMQSHADAFHQATIELGHYNP
jgi:predicted metal-binding transcription factor (methanogenesis marker protein 9)